MRLPILAVIFMADDEEDLAQQDSGGQPGSAEEAMAGEGEAPAQKPDEEEIARMVENFSQAGKAAAKVLREVPKLVLPGESYLDIAESLEKMIGDAGARPAFPANISEMVLPT